MIALLGGWILLSALATLAYCAWKMASGKREQEKAPEPRVIGMVSIRGERIPIYSSTSAKEPQR